MKATKLIQCSSARRAHVTFLFKSSLGPSPTLNNYATRRSQNKHKISVRNTSLNVNVSSEKLLLYQLWLCWCFLWCPFWCLLGHRCCNITLYFLATNLIIFFTFFLTYSSSSSQLSSEKLSSSDISGTQLWSESSSSPHHPVLSMILHDLILCCEGLEQWKHI